MRIVDRKTFLAMPEDTLFSIFDPNVFGALSIKLESIEDFDFYSVEIASSVKCEDSYEFNNLIDSAQYEKISLDIDLDCGCRDGGFIDKTFAVWEKKDIEQLIEKLEECLNNLKETY